MNVAPLCTVRDRCRTQPGHGDHSRNLPSCQLNFAANCLQQNDMNRNSPALSVACVKRGILMPSEGDWVDVPKEGPGTHCPDDMVFTLYLQK